MYDVNYNIIFSDVVNCFNYSYGFFLKECENLVYMLFILEEYMIYFLELFFGDVFIVILYIYDYDYKWLYLFLILIKEDGILVLINEVMMMGIN